MNALKTRGDYSIVDALVEPQVVGADVRLAIVEGIELLSGLYGQVSAATLRPFLLTEGWSRHVLDKRMGALLGAAARHGLEWTGTYVQSGNGLQRNENRAVKLYRLVDPAALSEFVARYDLSSYGGAA